MYRIIKDVKADVTQSLVRDILPVIDTDLSTPLKGSIAYNVTDDNIYYADSSRWIPLASGEIASLQNEGSGTGEVYDVDISTSSINYLRTLMIDPTIGNSGIDISTSGSEILIGNTLTAMNIGPNPSPITADIFSAKVGNQLEIKRLVAGSNISLQDTGSSIIIGSSGAGGGLSGLNNEGTGSDVFDQVIGSTAILRRINNGAGIGVTQNLTDITISATVANISNEGTGARVFDQISAGTALLRKLNSGPGVTIVENPTDITISAPSIPTSLFGVWHIRESQPSGTHAGTSVAGFQTRILNTISSSGPVPGNITLNSITFEITVAPGTYMVQGSAPMHGIPTAPHGHRIYVKEVISGNLVVSGTNATASASQTTLSTFSGFIAPLVSTKYILSHYSSAGKTIDGLGDAISSGDPEIYSQITLVQLG